MQCEELYDTAPGATLDFQIRQLPLNILRAFFASLFVVAYIINIDYV